MNIQDWFPLGWTGWISLQSKGLSRVFSNTKYSDKSGAKSGQWAFISSFFSLLNILFIIFSNFIEDWLTHTMIYIKSV